MKNSLIIFSLLLFFISCEEAELIDYTNGKVHISFVDTLGNDLLAPETVNSIDSADIDIYYLKNGELIHILDNNNELPENFKIYYYTPKSKYYLQLELSPFMVDSISETYITINAVTDTIITEYYPFDTGKAFKNIWYNDSVKIDSENRSKLFEVIK